MDENKNDTRKKNRFLHEKGVTWFDSGTERRIFFVLTMLMLLWGIITRITF